jgi:hypothetical protein
MTLLHSDWIFACIRVHQRLLAVLQKVLSAQLSAVVLDSQLYKSTAFPQGVYFFPGGRSIDRPDQSGLARLAFQDEQQFPDAGWQRR